MRIHAEREIHARVLPKPAGKKPMDLPLLLIVLTLVGIGLVMVLSASSVEGLAAFKNPYYFFERQVLWVAIGLGAMVVAARTDYHYFRSLALPGYLVTILLLVLVLIPGVGIEANGARRWLGAGSISLQPSELLKLSLIVLFAMTLSRSKITEPRGVLLHLGALGVSILPVLFQPDLGTSIAAGLTAVAMLYAAGMRPSHLGALLALSFPAVMGLIYLEPYRLRRFMAFLDPWQDPLGSGHQIIQGLYALGSGGLLGVGLGGSRLKFFYLPEQHTDFIFAILGEELGFLGALAVISLFLFLAWRGYRIALMAPDTFGMLLAVGVTTMLILQAFINLGAVTALLPITGITLPFISFGGSSMVFSLLGVGLLLNISRQVER